MMKRSFEVIKKDFQINLAKIIPSIFFQRTSGQAKATFTRIRRRTGHDCFKTTRFHIKAQFPERMRLREMQRSNSLLRSFCQMQW